MTTIKKICIDCNKEMELKLNQQLRLRCSQCNKNNYKKYQKKVNKEKVNPLEYTVKYDMKEDKKHKET